MSNHNMQDIELKRIVMVKAIVTPQFKSNLINELNRAINNIDSQLGQIDYQSDQYLEELKIKGTPDQLTDFKNKFEAERVKVLSQKTELEDKIKEAEDLMLGTEFTQGPLEGPVKVNVGDNLYKKVGAAEILVKDGIIIAIRGIDD
jgi:hypothetical protein